DATRAATFGADGTITTYDLATGKPTGRPVKSGTPVHHLVTLSPDGKTFAAFAGRTPKLWDPATGKERVTLAEPKGLDVVIALRFSGDGKTVMALGHNDDPKVYKPKVQLWDAVTGKARASHELGHVFGNSSVALSPDGKTLAVADREKHLELLD